MDAEQLVGKAVAALARGDIVGHMSHIAGDVLFQINENAPQNGKPAYQRMLEMLLASGEVIAGFTVVGNATRIGDQDVIQVHVEHIPTRHLLQGIVSPGEDEVIVRVDEQRQQPQHGPGERTVRSWSLPSFYTVRDHHIIRVKLAALSAGNRVYRYP